MVSFQDVARICLARSLGQRIRRGQFFLLAVARFIVDVRAIVNAVRRFGLVFCS
jgi:hypothetical protein